MAADRCVNWYPEVPEMPDAATPMAMYPSPGSIPWSGFNNSNSITALYSFDGRLYNVQSNGVFCQYLSTSPVIKANVVASTSPAQIEGNSNGQILVMSGNNMWMWPSFGATSKTITALASVQGNVNTPDTLVFTAYSWNGISVGQAVYFSSISAAPSLNGLSAQVLSIGGAGSLLTTTVPANYSNGYFGTTASTGSVNNGTSQAVGPGVLVTQIGFCDGFFLALAQNSATVYYSGVEDGITWDPTNQFTVSQFPEQLSAIFVDHREIWCFSSKRAVVYYNSGDLLNPFQPIPGAYVEQGIAAPFSTVRMDNSIFWLGADERGHGIAWRANGYTPTRVSNHAVENIWRQYSTIADAISYSFQMNGHTFWHIYFPTANASWRYDAATNMWHEVTWFNNGVANAHRSQCHAEYAGLDLVGDTQTTSVYQMAPENLSDTLNTASATVVYPIQRIRQAPHITNEQDWTFHQQLQVYLESGLGPVVSTAPTAILVKDSAGGYWNVGISNSGVVTTTATISSTLAGVVLNSGSGLFLVGVVAGSAVGLPVGNAGNAVTQYALQTPNGNLSYLTVNSSGVLSGSAPTAFGLPPQVVLDWSDDGGHTWSNQYMNSAGNVGEYKKRLMWRRLGRSRDRVYRITCTDPSPWRIVDSYLLAQPGYQVTPRLRDQLSKGA